MMLLHQIVGTVFTSIGILFIAIGVFGIYKYNNFYIRATISSLIDSAGFLFVSIGIIVYKGFSTFSFKILFLIILVLLLSPLSNHYIVRGAHNSGYHPRKEH